MRYSRATLVDTLAKDIAEAKQKAVMTCELKESNQIEMMAVLLVTKGWTLNDESDKSKHNK